MPQTARNNLGQVKFKKGWQSAPIHYPVLAVSQLSKTDKEKIRAVLKTVVSGEEAKQHFWRNGKENPERWGYVLKTEDGGVGAVLKNGIEVAYFIKRQVTRVQPGPGEPTPECVLKDPADSWVRVDLLGSSAREANQFLKKRQADLEDLCTAQAQRIRVLEESLVERESTAGHAADALTASEQLVVKLRKEIRNLKTPQEGAVKPKARKK